MKKETIELHRGKCTQGYVYISSPVSDSIILDAIVDFSRDKNVTIYRDILRVEEENISSVDFYEFQNLKIPYCEKVYYLDIYYQEK